MVTRGGPGANAQLEAELSAAKDRITELWKMNCLQLSEFDATLTQKEEEVASLRE